MSTHNLAVRLNVMQCQMARRGSELWSSLITLRADIVAWQAELRKIELELRGIDEKGEPT